MNRRLLEQIHVLIVDEDQPSRAQMQRIISDHGGIATGVATVERALEFLVVVRPNVVICDLRSGGGKGGLWLLDQLRNGEHVTVPVIATSRHADDEGLAATLTFNGFVAKPAEPHELCALVLGVVDPRRNIVPPCSA